MTGERRQPCAAWQVGLSRRLKTLISGGIADDWGVVLLEKPQEVMVSCFQMKRFPGTEGTDRFSASRTNLKRDRFNSAMEENF